MLHGLIPSVEKINFDIFVNRDGTVTVEENWKLTESNSNKIIMNLQTSNNGKTISDVKVFRRISDDVVEFIFGDFSQETIKTGNYSIIESGDSYTLLCGIGRYKEINVSYKVNDVVSLYADCADLQLGLMNRSMGINVEKINVDLHYPNKVDKPGVISAWKKQMGITSVITQKDKQKISLNISNVDNSGVGLRVLFPNSMFADAKNTSSSMMREKIIDEETEVVHETATKNTFVNLLVSLAVVVLLYIMLKKTFSYIKEDGKIIEKKVTEKIKYSRELPYNNITPGQATFLKNSGRLKEGDVFAATLLSLKIKGIIDIVSTGKEGRLGNTYVKILNIKPELTVEELPIFDFLIDSLEKFQKSDLMISLKMLQKYIAHASKVTVRLKKDMNHAIKKSVSSYDEKVHKRIKKHMLGILVYIVVLIATLIFPTKWFDVVALRFWTGLVAVINMIFCIKIIIKTSYFSQTGIDYREQLKGLENYMLDFSKYKQKGVPELSIWEYYIIFAMSFGISKQVLEQIISCYPNIEETTFMEKYKVAQSIEKCNFRRGFMMSV